MTWTVAEARSVGCPQCGAAVGVPCTYRGRGAAKAMRAGRSHQDRIDAMLAARPITRRAAAQLCPRGGETIIWTDGSCLRNPGGPGGWAAIIVRDGVSTEVKGSDPRTTNNRMELMAAIAGLEALDRRSLVRLRSDSRYVIDGVTKWLPAWKRRGWKLRTGGEVKNADLWRRLDAAAERHWVRFEWVKGHAGTAGNERADRLSGEMARAIRGGREAIMA